jgi:hypothetical protein
LGQNLSPSCKKCFQKRQELVKLPPDVANFFPSSLPAKTKKAGVFFPGRFYLASLKFASMCKVCLVFHFTSSLRANLGRIPKKTCLEQTTYIAFFSTLMVAKRLCKIEVKQSLTENIYMNQIRFFG